MAAIKRKCKNNLILIQTISLKDSLVGSIFNGEKVQNIQNHLIFLLLFFKLIRRTLALSPTIPR